MSLLFSYFSARVTFVRPQLSLNFPFIPHRANLIVPTEHWKITEWKQMKGKYPLIQLPGCCAPELHAAGRGHKGGCWYGTRL